MTFFQFLDLAGVAVFAATGALAASRKQLDIIGFIFLAGLAGIGGGTVRDLVLGITPVFWVTSSTYIGVCTVTALVVYVTAPYIESRYRLLLWLDAIGLAAYCVMGAERGLEAGAAPLVAIVCGMLSASFGGVLRDVISGEPSVLLRREIYITAALVGAALFVLLQRGGVDPVLAAGTAALGAFIVRGGALAFGWTMPGYRGRPGRPADEV